MLIMLPQSKGSQALHNLVYLDGKWSLLKGTQSKEIGSICLTIVAKEQDAAIIL